MGPQELVLVNIGDSRTMLARSGKVIVATVDHKPTDSKEVCVYETGRGCIIFPRQCTAFSWSDNHNAKTCIICGFKPVIYLGPTSNSCELFGDCLFKMYHFTVSIYVTLFMDFVSVPLCKARMLAKGFCPGPVVFQGTRGVPVPLFAIAVQSKEELWAVV